MTGRRETGSPCPPHPRIIVVGDLVTDVLAVLAGPLSAGSDTPAGIRLTGGGQGANTATWLSWHGTPATLVAAVGTDEAGRTRVAELSAAGVQCAVSEHPDVATGTVIVLARDGDRTMITDRGANLRLGAADIDAALAAAPDAAHLHLSGYTLLDEGSRAAGRHALSAARACGLTTSVDAASAAPLRQVGAPAFLGWVRGTDLLLANTDEAAVLAGEKDPRNQAQELAAAVDGQAVVKRGAEGAVWAGPDAPPIVLAARPVPVADPTGAGDAFAAGLLAAWVRGSSAPEALGRAVELGAVAVSTVGARPPSG